MKLDEALALHVAHPFVKVKVFNAACVEAAAAAYDAMNLVTLVEKQLGQERAVLPGNTCYQCYFVLFQFHRII